MIAETSLELALRAHALSLVVATTGSVSLAATATGYTRSSGSFIADGLAPGMEFIPAGFTTTTPQTITAVSALAITASGTRTAQAAASGRSLTVKLPSRWAWEGITFNPTAGVPWVQEAFIGGPNFLRSAVIDGSMEQRGQYVLTVHAPIGTALTARLYADAIVRGFRPGLTLAITGGDVLRIRAAPNAPSAGQLRPTEPGFQGVTASIPFWLLALNAAA